MNKEERKPDGFWKDEKNIIAVAHEIIGQFGYLPSKTKLEKEGYKSFCTKVVSDHGGFRKLRESLGLEQIVFERGHWEDFDNVKIKLEEVEKHLGHFPTQAELAELGEYGLTNAIGRNHGGLVNVAEKMGRELSYKKRGFWKEWENIDERLDKLTAELGHFPKYEEIKKYDSPLLRGIEHHHTGYNAVRLEKGLPLQRKEKGYWEDRNNLLKEAREFMREHDFKMLPSSDVLLELDAGDLDGAIKKYGGGFRELRVELGGINPTKTKKEIEKGLEEPLQNYLIKKYQNKHRSSKDIAKELGTNQFNILRWIKKEGIRVRSISESMLPPNLKIPSKEELEDFYVKQRESTIEIAEKYGVSNYTVSKWLKDVGIAIRNNSERHFKLGGRIPSEDELRRDYLDNWMSQNGLGGKYCVSSLTIRNWLRKFNIPIRNQAEAKRPKDFISPLKEQLEKWYIEEEKTAREIAENLGVSKGFVLDLLEKNGVEARDRSYKINRLKLAKKNLESMYLTQGKSPKTIGEKIGVSAPTVIKWLCEYNIPLKSKTEAYIKKGGRIPSEEELINWYVEEHKTTTEIAEICGISDPTVGNLLRKYEIYVRDRRGIYDDKKNRKKAFDELLIRSKKQPETVSCWDFQNVKSEEGTCYSGLLGWYIRNYDCKHRKARDILLNDLCSLPIGKSIHNKRETIVHQRDLVDWDSFKKAVEKLFEEHSELEGKLPSSKWLEGNCYGALARAARNLYGGIHAVREKLGQDLLRKPNGYWKNLGKLCIELERIIESHEELNGNLPSSKWLNDHDYSYITTAVRRYHNGFFVFREKFREYIGLKTESNELENLVKEYIRANDEQ